MENGFVGMVGNLPYNFYNINSFRWLARTIAHSCKNFCADYYFSTVYDFCGNASNHKIIQKLAYEMRLMNSVSLLKMTFKYTSLFFLLFVSNPTQSQITNCAINAIRYNDDFQYLKGDSLKHGLDKLKYINIGGNANVSFGGELREQYQYFRNQNFGDVPPSFERRSTGQLLHRLMLHSNIEIGSKTRFFIQLSSTFRLFNPNPISPEVDENQLSLHQAFVDYSFNKNLKVRLGRQELGYGSYKILTFREGANTRLTFDGVIVKYKSEKRNMAELPYMK